MGQSDFHHLITLSIKLWEVKHSQMGLDARKTCLQEFVNNTGTDQPAYLRSLISTFVIYILESTISKLATSEISFF